MTFIWFYSSKRSQPPGYYAQLIDDYDPSDDRSFCSENCIDEAFTADEARQLKEYLDREHGDAGTTTIREMSLPIPCHRAGWGAIAVGGGDDFYMLFEEAAYSLPFKVEGYFNLVGLELIDGSDVYHHRLLVVFPNGEMRMQTNEEAAAMERRGRLHSDLIIQNDEGLPF